MRIISTVPSITELLYTLRLGEEVVGITKFCIHPDLWFRNKTRIGGTKDLNLEKIRGLKPDLIIANKEENDRKQIESLATEFEVLVTDVCNLSETLEMIKSIGRITNKVSEANQLKCQISNDFDQLQPQKKYSAVYLIWQDPIMTIGGDTFIDDMMSRCGFENIYQPYTRYPILETEQLKKAAPDLLLLSSEPYPFKKKHADYYAQVLPDTKVILVDGEYFSWYGSRLVGSVKYFRELLERL